MSTRERDSASSSGGTKDRRQIAGLSVPAGLVGAARGDTTSVVTGENPSPMVASPTAETPREAATEGAPQPTAAAGLQRPGTWDEELALESARNVASNVAETGDPARAARSKAAAEGTT